MKIAVWYHCKLSGDGIPSEDAAISIMYEQMEALKNSGLAEAAEEIHIGVNGDDGQGLLAASLAPDESVVHVHGKDARSELPTFALIRHWIPCHQDWAVLYHHSKGVTKPYEEFHHHHRRTMEAAVVWKWKRCVDDLERGYDAVGINLVDPKTRPVLPGRFFAGNFWWARADYLAQLRPIPDSCRDYSNTEERCLAEGWVGNNSPRRPMMLDYERPHLYEVLG